MAANRLRLVARTGLCELAVDAGDPVAKQRQPRSTDDAVPVGKIAQEGLRRAESCSWIVERREVGLNNRQDATISNK